MKTFIHPRYSHLEAFIRDIPQGNYQVEQVYCDHRNRVERVRHGDSCFVIKKYKKPTFINRIVYTWFRKDKATRAFINAEELQQKGFETASPVACIIGKRHGLLHTAYFISEYLPYPTLAEFYPLITDDAERRQLEHGLMDFTIRLHLNDIAHPDYNAGNIMVHKEADGYHFALIDLNRITINKPVRLRRAMASFDRMNIDTKTLIELVMLYARDRGLNAEDCLFYALYGRRLRNKTSKLKHGVKHLLPKTTFLFL